MGRNRGKGKNRRKNTQTTSSNRQQYGNPPPETNKENKSLSPPVSVAPIVNGTVQHEPIKKAPEKPSPNGPSPPKGLVNLGNTCFMNSVLQVLSQTPALLSLVESKIEPNQSDEVSLGFVSVLNMMKSHSATNPGVVNPNRVLQGIQRKSRQFRGLNQQDSHELLRTLLDLVRTDQITRQTREVLSELKISDLKNADDDLKFKVKTLSGLTTIDSLFGGFMLSSVKCQGCDHVSQLMEPFFDLSLPIRSLGASNHVRHNFNQKNANNNRKQKGNRNRNRYSFGDEDEANDDGEDEAQASPTSMKRMEIDVKDDYSAKIKWSLSTVESVFQYSNDKKLSLESCLSLFTAAEFLTGTNRVSCDKCKEKCESCKQMLIAYPPPILTLHLKRFQAERTGWIQKINNLIPFPFELDLSPWVSKIWTQLASHFDVTSSVGLTYSLFGIVQHSGGLKSGHYTAKIKIRGKTSNEKNIQKFLRLKPFISNVQDFLNKIHLDDLDHNMSNGDGASGGDTDDDQELLTDGRWYHVSDSSVTPISKDSVLNSQAYLLFYERI